MAKKHISVKKENNNIFKISGIFILVLVLVFIGSFYFRQYTEDKYSDYDFKKSENGNWLLTIELNNQPYNIPFYNHPEDVEYIKTEGDFANPILSLDKNEGTFVISMDPDVKGYMQLPAIQIARITSSSFNILNINTVTAFFNETNFETDKEIIDCSYASEKVVVLHLTEGNENSIITNGNCITMTVTDAESSKEVSDRFVYELLQII